MFLNQSDSASVKKSYLHILRIFLNREEIKTKYMTCLLKWGMHLRLDKFDLKDLDQADTFVGEDDETRAEAIYHLVYMIYLDNKVEDVELEVASIYSEALGFNKTFVADLFKSLVTAPADGSNPREVKEEIQDFLRLYGKK
jgi:hypothetical protein